MSPRALAPDPEMLAVQALGFLAEDTGRLTRFLDITGISPATLRQAAQSPTFLASVLAYLMADESLLLAFAAQVQVRPETLAPAEAALSRR
ncbi:Protein of unknown function DUF3572 [Rhabdaerophilaceae bacterium]